MKYIVTENHSDNDKEEIFVFPNSINHDSMFEGISRLKNKTWGNLERQSRVAISSGFILCGKCIGKSQTLRIESRPYEDTELFKNL